MINLLRTILTASAVFFYVGSTLAQNSGTVTNHALPIGKGPGVAGYGSLGPCTNAFTIIGKGASTDPACGQLDLTAGVTGTLPAGNGGTGIATLVIGDILQASSATTLARLAAVASGNVLLSGGIGAASTWGKVGLTTHVTGVLPGANMTAANLASSGNGGVTGQLPIANNCPGATGASNTTFLRGDCTWATPTGAGNVSGPGSSVNGNLASFNGTSGTVIADSGLSAAAIQTLLNNQLIKNFLTPQNSFFVAKTGTDTGTCISGSPCLTIGYATTQALRANTNGNQATISIGAGTYTESVNVLGTPLNYSLNGIIAQILYQGAGATTIWAGRSGDCSTLSSNNGGSVAVRQMTMNGNGDPCQSTLYAQLGGKITVQDGMTFGAASFAQINLENSSLIQVTGNYTLTGGAQFHIAAVDRAGVGYGPITVTIQNGPTFSQNFIHSTMNSAINIPGVTWSGATNGGAGNKYKIEMNSTLETGGNLTGIPGATPSPGTLTGGQAE